MTSTDKSAAAPVSATSIEQMCSILKEHQIKRDEYTDCTIVYKVTFDQLRNLYDAGRASLPPADPGAVVVAYIDPIADEAVTASRLATWPAHNRARYTVPAYAAPSIPSASLTTPSKEPAGAVAQINGKPPGPNLPAPSTCLTCGETMPFTGSCGTTTDDTKALCRASPGAAPGAAIDAGGQLSDAGIEAHLTAMLAKREFPDATAGATSYWLTPEEIRELFRRTALASRPEAPAASAPAAEVAQPVIGWLYDWVHSSALGKPDEHFTSFTADEAYARKHSNVRAVALASPPSIAPAESGWQWVPKEPTDEMTAAAAEEVAHCQRAGRLPLSSNIYRAMLAASPQAVQAGGEGGNG